MKVESTEEVRFRASPIIINEDMKPTGRPHATINSQGLLELDLSGRRLREVPVAVLNLMRLEVLRLNNNHLERLPNDLSRLHRLRVLHLQHNVLSSLPDTIPNFIHLQELDAGHNQLTQLPQALVQLQQLNTLRLGHNRFEELPEAMGSLTQLQRLDLSHNQLWHLPTSFQEMNHLIHLDLSYNIFDQLPVGVCTLRHLEALNLQGNQIRTLPSMDQLQRLKELNVAANRLEVLPQAVTNLRHLAILDVSANRLSSLPSRLAALTRLKVLRAHSNALTSIPNQLESLQTLDVSHNQLRNFSLAGMKQLRQLNASHNQLENLPLGVYVLPHLEILNVNTNHISYLSQDVVLLHNLRVLDLGNNCLTTLPQVVDELSHLETFNIRGNKIETRPLYVKPQSGLIKGGNPGYMSEEDEEEGSHTHRPHPLFRKKSRVYNNKGRRKKKWRQQQSQTPHSRSTQYTPRSSIKSRDRPPLDYVPKSGSLSTLFTTPKRRPSIHSKFSHNISSHNVSSHNVSSHASGIPEQQQQQKPLAEIQYPITTQKNPETPAEDTEVDRGSLRSDTVTVNETVGDGLSLGDEDFEYQPITVRDRRLMDVCSEVENMLNQQLLQPITANKGLFNKKTMNEGGTVRMLKAFGSMPNLTEPEVQHRPSDIIMKPRPPAPPLEHSASIWRSKMDTFMVTPAGGMFRSSTDANVGIYFPVNAVQAPIRITLQLEQIPADALCSARGRNPLVDNLLSVGPVLHVRPDRLVEMHHQVALTLPPAPAPQRGFLHVLTFRENHGCSPCSAHYKQHKDGYVTLQTWHFSGKGIVMTKSRNKYKACKSMEQLLRELYI